MVVATAPAARDVDGTLRFAGWVLDLARRQLKTEAGRIVHLTPTEYVILALLARHPRQTVSRGRLLAAASGRDWAPADRSIDVHISNLRRKLDPGVRHPSLIRAVRGAGYTLTPSRF